MAITYYVFIKGGKAQIRPMDINYIAVGADYGSGWTCSDLFASYGTLVSEHSTYEVADAAAAKLSSNRNV